MSARAHRIVVYTEAVGRGGAEVSLRNLVRELAAPHEVTVVGVDEEICRWIAGARPGTEAVIVRPVATKVSLPAFLALRRTLRRLRPDIVHLNLRTIADAQYAVIAALTVRGAHVVVVEQLPFAPESGRQRWLKRLTSRRLAGHVAVGERAARQVEAIAGLPPGSVGTIYNGVPDVPVSGPRDDDFTVGSLARLDAIKGLDILLDAVSELSGVNVLLLGDGPEREALEARASHADLAGRVEIAGWDDRARDRLGELDVFVLPSHNEGFPLSIVEAMLAGLPVVATDVGSVDEAVLDGETGFVVPAGEAEALREAIRRLRDDPALRSRLGESGRARARREFTAATMARRFEQLYDEATDSSSASIRST